MVSQCRICLAELPEKADLLLQRQPPRAQRFSTAPEQQDAIQRLDLKVKQCPACAVVQLDNEPVSYYREVIRAAGISPTMQKFRQRQFANFRRKYQLEGKKLIEFGCGQGEYLQCWKSLQAVGMEFSAENCRLARSKGLQIIQGYIGETLPSDRPYQGFSMHSWLEHLPDIRQVLQNIRCCLDHDAVGLIEVPDFEMICRRNLVSEFIIDHLFYFTRQTLQNTLASLGFEVLRIRNIWHDYIISAEVRMHRSFDASAFSQAQTRLLQQLDDFLEQQKIPIPIWGASHQALSLLAASRKKDKVACIIDAADFKQNRYSPGSNLPIVAPETLTKLMPDALLIIAGSYNKEIIASVRQKYGYALRLACIEGNELVQL
ncbi:MAG: class I SAM-dependent methyltransferase [Oligosphaeraceae bacterium]|nr:class I SAM-dependent methyltransferase [Oligosphaeraceae bacterium]